MRRTLPTPPWKTLLLTSVIAFSVAGCTTEPPVVEDPVTAEPAPPLTSEAAPAVDGLPIDTLPEVPGGRGAWEACPYVDTEWVAETNGQRVTGLGVDERFTTPACVFWSYPEEPQLTILVREMASVDEAIDVVDWAAPVDSTEPAEEPLGWSGGRRGGSAESGALYAVQKDSVAVVVFTNQDQSLKAQLVAEEVIGNLGL